MNVSCLRCNEDMVLEMKTSDIVKSKENESLAYIYGCISCNNSILVKEKIVR